ncbi:MAG: hydrogenase maturation protease [Candidatus Heimdallarchaeota archaeon]
MKEAYRELEKRLYPLLRSQKLVIVGIGNILHGDDGIGVLIAEEIKKSVKNVTVIIGATTPENVLSPVIRSKPNLVLIIDAADFGGNLGSIAVFEPSTVKDEAYFGSSHALPISMFASAIKQELEGVTVLVVGIQTRRGFLGSKISEEVHKAANWLISFIQEADGTSREV